MKSKPDDRGDNAERIQSNINFTLKNIEAADDMIAKTPDDNIKKALEDKNERRRRALEGLRREIKDETKVKK